MSQPEQMRQLLEETELVIIGRYREIEQEFEFGGYDAQGRPISCEDFQASFREALPERPLPPA